MNPSAIIIRDAVRQAIGTGKSFHDYWYYNLDHGHRMLFSGFMEFENRCEAAFSVELKRKDDEEERRGVAIEAYWREKQGEDYGSY